MFTLFRKPPPQANMPTEERRAYTSFSMAFALGIRRARIKAGITQPHLAEKLSVTQQTINKWEAGDALPKMERLRDIIGYLNADLYDLIYGPCADFETDLKNMLSEIPDEETRNTALSYADDILKDPIIKTTHRKDPRYSMFLELIANAITEEAERKEKA